LPDGHPERARVIPLYVDTSTEGKDPRASAPPRPQAERPEAPQPIRARNFLNEMFGLNISTSMLRHIYLSKKYSEVEENMKKDAVLMGHSANTQSQYIVK
jgi:hypothetical protein